MISVEEKPKHPKSNYCITGLYFYHRGVSWKARAVRPSARGGAGDHLPERGLSSEGRLKAQILGRGFAWMDMGTMDSLAEATQFVQMIEKRQGVKISAPEEIAFRKGWISEEALLRSAEAYGKSPYGEHLKRVADKTMRY